MTKTITFFLVFFSAVGLGVFVYHHPGHVLISFKEISVEASAWLAILITILAQTIFLLSIKLLTKIFKTTSIATNWFKNHKLRKARRLFEAGWHDLTNGNWRPAEKNFSRAAKYGHLTPVNYLAAAFSAFKQHLPLKQDYYLNLAIQAAGKNSLTAGLIKAFCSTKSQELPEAKKTLERLYQIFPKNHLVLELLSSTYQQQGNWLALKMLLTPLKKYQVLNRQDFFILELAIYQNLLQLATLEKHPEQSWEKIPGPLKKEPVLIAIYVEWLLSTNETSKTEKAEQILKAALHHKLDESLLGLYAKLNSLSPLKQLDRAEHWLVTSPDNYHLLITLGTICRKQQLWGKAKFYLNASIEISPTATAYAELGQLIITEQKEPLNTAISYYQKALAVALATNKTN